MKPNPFGARLQEQQPLSISPLTPLPDIHHRPHISLTLKSTNPPEAANAEDISLPTFQPTDYPDTDDFKYW